MNARRIALAVVLTTSLMAPNAGRAQTAASSGGEMAAKYRVVMQVSNAEPRGWKLAEEKAGWYLDQLKANKMKVLPPSDALKSGMMKIGDQLTSDWAKKAGPDGAAVIESYKKM